jgi:hypothetical protein
MLRLLRAVRDLAPAGPDVRRALWRPAGRWDAALAGAWAAAALSLLAARPWASSAAAALGLACPLRHLTGIPCATCGATRAALALAEGRWPDALAANPLLAAGGLAFVAGGLIAPLWLAAARRVPVVPRGLPLPWRLALGGALVGNWLFVALRAGLAR